MIQTLIVAAGGALGAALRHWTTLAAQRLFGAGFPWGTLAVNVIGSFLMGVIVEYIARRFGTGNGFRLFLATGLLGGYTTFSAFSLDAVDLWERGGAAPAAGYVAASVLASIAALAAGLALARAVF